MSTLKQAGGCHGERQKTKKVLSESNKCNKGSCTTNEKRSPRTVVNSCCWAYCAIVRYYIGRLIWRFYYFKDFRNERGGVNGSL